MLITCIIITYVKINASRNFIHLYNIFRLRIIYVNKKYLENYHFVDNDNHDIDINKINDQTILVPKKYQNKQIHETGTIINVKNR